jgi:RNA polymerase sigma-70 factor (ECF subfamily)
MIDWESILAEHGPTVWRTVYRLLEHHADAQDCYQETFLAAVRFAERHAVVDWSSFLVSVAARRAMDRLRQRYRARNHCIPIGDVPEPSGEVDGPLQQARANELLDRVREGLSELAEKQAEVFWLICLEGFSHQQVADLMGIPSAEVRVLLHRARLRLGASLSRQWFHERKTP